MAPLNCPRWGGEGCRRASKTQCWLSSVMREVSVLRARTRRWYGIRTRGAVKDETCALFQGKALKFCDADRFDLFAEFGTDHYPRDLFNPGIWVAIACRLSVILTRVRLPRS
jgi:hypothetical protein